MPRGRPCQAFYTILHCSFCHTEKPCLVEHRGFEPLTSSMPWKRATNCANAPKTSPEGDIFFVPRLPGRPARHYRISPVLTKSAPSPHPITAGFTARSRYTSATATDRPSRAGLPHSAQSDPAQSTSNYSARQTSGTPDTHRRAATPRPPATQIRARPNTQFPPHARAQHPERPR